MAAKKTAPTRAAKIQEVQATQVLSSVQRLGGLEKVAQSIAKTQVDLQQSLAALSGTLVEKLDELGNVEQAIVLKQAELKQLHEIEATANTLDALQSEIENKRAEWAKEQEATVRGFKEQGDERRKQWAREGEEYAYKTGQDRRAADDAWKAQQAKVSKEQADRLEVFNKQMAEREAAIKAKESEFARLQAFEAGYAEAVKREVAKAEAVVTNSLKKHYETEAKLAAMSSENAAKMAEAATAALKGQLAEKDQTITSLRQDLAKAHADAKEIAQAAVNAQSGRQALEALQRAQENAGAPAAKPGR